MFTGIIESLGCLGETRDTRTGRKLTVHIGGLSGTSPQPGDSVAVNGVCLTVTEIAGSMACFDVSEETLASSLISSWKTGDLVNVERALTLQTPLGGHLVSGHVDGFAKVASRKDKGDFTEFAFELPGELGKFMAVKGSVAIDGVSLTVNQVMDKPQTTCIVVMLVPHTLNHTALGALSVDCSVHVEVDQIARYIHRLDQFRTKEL